MTTLRITFAKDTSLPTVGDVVSVAVEGGQDWLNIGRFVEAHWIHDTGEAALCLELDPAVVGVAIDP